MVPQSLSVRSSAVRHEPSIFPCDPANACCLDPAPSASSYETVKPRPDFLKEMAVKTAHILVGGPLFGCSTSEGPRTSPYVRHLHQRTNAQGEVSFPERNVRAVVRNEDGNPIPGITVHYAFKDEKNVVLAIDPSGNYIPERAVFSGTSLRRGGNRRYAASVGEFIEFVLENPKAVDEIVEQLGRPHSGDLLEEEEDVNRYCMSLEQITNKTIDVPAGLVVLAPEAAGVNTTLVRRAATALLGEIAERHIISRYGEQAGYEVWVPRTAMSVCGEEFDGAVCDISGGQLEQIWNPELPYWRINGSCTPAAAQGCSGEVLFEDEFEGEELDLEKWDYPVAIPLRDGVLELIGGSVGGINGGEILNSRSTYTLDDRTLCFEARWRVGEREGTTFGVLLGNDRDEGRVGFVERDNELSCFVVSYGDLTQENCNANTTEFIRTRVEINEEGSLFYVNNKSIIPRIRGLPDLGYAVGLSCQSQDQLEHSCYIDYVKLQRR